MRAILAAGILTLSASGAAIAASHLENAAAILFPNAKAIASQDDADTILIGPSADGRTFQGAMTAEDKCTFVVKSPGPGELTLGQKMNVSTYRLRNFREIHSPYPNVKRVWLLVGTSRCTRVDVLGKAVGDEDCSSGILIGVPEAYRSWQSDLEGLIKECKRSPRYQIFDINRLTQPALEQPSSGRSLIDNMRSLAGPPEN